MPLTWLRQWLTVKQSCEQTSQYPGRASLPKNTWVHDVLTRWNSSFHMLQRLLEQRRPLTTMSAEMDLGGVMSHHQWELVQATMKILQPFEEATRTVCEDVASLSSVIPCVQALKTALTNLKMDADTGSSRGT